MRQWARVWLVGALLGALTGLSGTALADCPAASIEVRPATAERGNVVTVSGEFFSECRDVGGPCSNPGTSPFDSVTVELRRNGAAVITEMVEPDERGDFQAQLWLDPGLAPGSYDVTATATPADANSVTASATVEVRR